MKKIIKFAEKLKSMDHSTIDLGKGNVPALFAKIFVPTLVGMIFGVLLSIADGIFVGHGCGSDALAAVNIVSPFFNVSSGIGFMFGSGASVVIAIHLSRDNIKAARINATQALSGSLLIMSFIVLLCCIFPTEILKLLGCTDKLMPLALDYFYFTMFSCVVYMFEAVGMYLVRLDGSPNYASFCTVLPSVLNIVLDYIFIFPLDMGLKGAALATFLSCCASGVAVLVYMKGYVKTLKLYPLKLSKKISKISSRNLWSMLRLGFPVMLGEFSMSVMMLVGNRIFVQMLHEDGVAAFSVVCYLIPIFFMLSSAITQSAQPIVSYNYGAGNEKRVSAAFGLTLLTAVFCGSIVTLLFVYFPEPLTLLFLKENAQAFPIAINGLKLFAVGFVAFALNIVFIGFYQSIEFARRAIWFTLLRGFFLMIPAFIVLPKFIGVDGLWLAVPCSEFITFAVILIDFVILKRSEKWYKNINMSEE